MACPAAEMAPEAPKVQKRYRAESAGMARPDVMDVVYIIKLVSCVLGYEDSMTYTNTRKKLDECMSERLHDAVRFREIRPVFMFSTIADLQSLIETHTWQV
jgi:hypothetical protein